VHRVQTWQGRQAQDQRGMLLLLLLLLAQV
jgi:hypothetical protein